MRILKLFRIRKEERAAAIVAPLVLLTFHALMICHLFDKFIRVGVKSWNTIITNFVFSGFDPITYYIVTEWVAKYNVYRHPLLAFFVWPLSKINGLLMDLTGLNFMQFLVAVPLIFCSFYSFIFLYRIFRDIVKIRRTDSIILAAMLFSFAYIMLAAIVPDHFCFSMFLLIFSLYICGTLIERKQNLGIWKTVLLAIITAGVTLTNGVKIYAYALFTNGKRFFRIRYLVFAIIIPSALLWKFARWEYHTFVWPSEMQRKQVKARNDSIRREKAFIAFADTVGITDSVELYRAFDVEMRKRAYAKYVRDRKKASNAHTGKPMAKGEFLRWTDISTSRTESVVENLFGESIQFHDQHFLEDTLRSRPVIIRYSWFINYVVEAIVVLLFIIGIWCGRRSRFLWAALSGFAFDMCLHLGLGFGLNEVYIMGAHWLFVLPISTAFLVKAVERKLALSISLRVLLLLLTLWLWGYNAWLLVGYLLG